MGIFRRIWALGRRSKLDREIEDELREHLQMRTDANIAKGMSPEQAARAARLRFGNPDSDEGACRGRGRGPRASKALFRDVRYALRGFAKSPGFTTVAIITLALGIGANTAVFQLLDAVRLRSLPIQKPQELAELRIIGGNQGFGVNDWPLRQLHHPHVAGGSAPSRSLLRRLRLARGGRDGRPAQRREACARARGEWRILQRARRPALAGAADRAAGRSRLRAVEGRRQLSLLESADGRRTHHAEHHHPGRRPLGAGVGRNPAVLLWASRGRHASTSPIPPASRHNPRREMFILSVMGRLKPGWDLARASAYFGALSPGLFESTAPTGYSAEAIKTFKSFRLAAYPAGCRRERAARRL